MVDSVIPKKLWPKKSMYVCTACPVVNTKACDRCIMASWNVEAIISWQHDKHPQTRHSDLFFPERPRVRLPKVVFPSYNVVKQVLRG